MYIVSTGLVCPIGLTAVSACAAMRAGIAMFEELPYMDNSCEPIVGAMVPGLEPNLKREVRLIELLSAALLDCLRQGYPQPLDRVPLLVGLAERGRPGGGAALADEVVSLIEQKLQVRFHPRLSRAIPGGHTAGFEALAVARELLRDPHIPACVVSGVDSYINAGSLLWLDQHWRLKTEENSDGVIPGEAAAVVLLKRQPLTNTIGAVKVRGLGFGSESASVLSEDPLMGEGLTQATRAALSEARMQMHDIDFRLSDVTGESYGFREQALVVAKLLRVHQENGYPLWHCSENVGDIGAASGIHQLIIAFHAFNNMYAPGECAAGFTSTVTGRRTVALIQQTIG